MIGRSDWAYTVELVGSEEGREGREERVNGSWAWRCEDGGKAGGRSE